MATCWFVFGHRERKCGRVGKFCFRNRKSVGRCVLCFRFFFRWLGVERERDRVVSDFGISLYGIEWPERGVESFLDFFFSISFFLLRVRVSLRVEVYLTSISTIIFINHSKIPIYFPKKIQ